MGSAWSFRRELLLLSVAIPRVAGVRRFAFSSWAPPLGEGVILPPNPCAMLSSRRRDSGPPRHAWLGDAGSVSGLAVAVERGPAMPPLGRRSCRRGRRTLVWAGDTVPHPHGERCSNRRTFSYAMGIDLKVIEPPKIAPLSAADVETSGEVMKMRSFLHANLALHRCLPTQ